MLSRITERWSRKSTARCSVKLLIECSAKIQWCSKSMLTGFLQNYCEIFRKNTEKCAAKILIRGLQKYWKVFCGNIKRCSAKLLKNVLQNRWGEFHNLDTKWTTFFVKAKGLGLFFVTSWPSILWGQKIIRNYWEHSHWWYFLKHEKGDIGDRRSYDL